MASGGQWGCPICCNALSDVAYWMPCGHQFCLGCILRWVRQSCSCPLCRTPISYIRLSEWQEDSREPSSQEGNAPCSRDENTDGALPASSPQGTPSPAGQEAAGAEPVGGILPELWAELFRSRRSLLAPVRSWLQPRLERMYGDRWWQITLTESCVLLSLCTFGPHRELLVQRLQLRLQEDTAPLVHGIVSTIETQCSQEVRRLWRSHAPLAEGQSPGDSPVPAASRGRDPASSSIPHSSGQEGAGTTEDALQGSAGCPTPEEQP
ncbi:E3 ubiquitin-protein ligase Topors-like protein [Willisornis vidua]|uniref:E3 ubiquitin-protein ligase Topors-like protein n=1 Tax=Willisornis vidua TaxID=1566151 RepID=A0ABQ9DV18_9PASS|nr:E3 ubiquitin-protein ligase Topors-like protein [Willisornis vidua]